MSNTLVVLNNNREVAPLVCNNEVVITTKMLAGVYECEERQIQQNFNNNPNRFEEGKHYYKLTGEKLKQFKNCIEDFEAVGIGKRTRNLILWTKRGASRHCKMLGTDKAWDMFDVLEENYFNPKRQPQQVLSVEQITQIVTVAAQAAAQAAIAPIMDRFEKLIATKEAPKTRAVKTRAANFSTLPTVRNIAKPFGITPIEANKILEKHGIIRRSDNGKGSILNEEYEDRWGTTIYEDGKEPYVRYFDLGVNSITKIFSRITNASEQEQLDLF